MTMTPRLRALAAFVLAVVPLGLIGASTETATGRQPAASAAPVSQSTQAPKAAPPTAKPAPPARGRTITLGDVTAFDEGWYFDATDRRGVLHVKTKAQSLASAWTVTIGM